MYLLKIYPVFDREFQFVTYNEFAQNIE